MKLQVRTLSPWPLRIEWVYLEDPNCMCIYDNQSTHENVDRLIQHDRCLMGSDAWLYPSTHQGTVHPRNFAAFTGFLTRYVRNGPISMESGLQRITSRAADSFCLDAGHIAEGHRADLALFDLDNLLERANFKNPCQLSHGIDGVWIGGTSIFKNHSRPIGSAENRVKKCGRRRIPTKESAV